MPFDASDYGNTHDPIADVLRQARNTLVRRGGWIKGSLGEHGRHCALGAIAAVRAPNQVVVRGVINILAKVIGEGYGATPNRNVVNWNDHKSRKKKQVIDAFNRAIAARMESIALAALKPAKQKQRAKETVA